MWTVPKYNAKQCTRPFKKYLGLSSEIFLNSVREGTFFGSLVVLSYILYSSTELVVSQLFQKQSSQLACMFLYHHTNSAHQNLKQKRSFIKNVVLCFFFNNNLFNTLRVIYLLYSKIFLKKSLHWEKAVCVLADDKPGYFLSCLIVWTGPKYNTRSVYLCGFSFHFRDSHGSLV